LIPARAGLKAVAVPQGRNIQAGTAILNTKYEVYLYDKKIFVRFDQPYVGSKYSLFGN
jgi:hypothetical protein